MARRATISAHAVDQAFRRFPLFKGYDWADLRENLAEAAARSAPCEIEHVIADQGFLTAIVFAWEKPVTVYFAYRLNNGVYDVVTTLTYQDVVGSGASRRLEKPQDERVS